MDNTPTAPAPKLLVQTADDREWPVILYRGSGSDLAADCLSVLSEAERLRFLAHLARHVPPVDRYPNPIPTESAQSAAHVLIDHARDLYTIPANPATGTVPEWPGGSIGRASSG